MKKIFSFGLLTALVVSTGAVFAQSSAYPYTDSPGDSFTQQAVTDLTDRGIVGGYPDGSFRPAQQLNRAEYMKIVMNLKQNDGSYTPHCFPDVPAGSWFEPFVCRAKMLGIVHGNLPPAPCDGCRNTFDPSRNVNYAEALKVLFGIYDIPVRARQGNEQWYEPYIQKALSLDLDLRNHEPGTFLTRGNMAILVFGFITYESEQSSSSHSSSSSSFSSSSSQRSSSSSASSRVSDPLGDASPRSQLLLLGETSPMLAAASFFSDTEPVDVTKLSVDFGIQQHDINSILFYDEHRSLIGRASPNGAVAGRYTLTLPSGSFQIPKRQDVHVYIRADLRTKDAGGTSHVVIQPAQFVLEGNGAWSNNAYTKTSSDTFDIFLTSRSTITDIANAGQQKDLLVGGPERTLGAFRLGGRLTDGSAKLIVTDLTFTLTKNNVSLSNVVLRADGSSDFATCSVGSSTIVCHALPEFIGSLTGGPRTLTLYGDVTMIDPLEQNSLLQVSLGNFGSALSSGTISWNDGSSDFDWVPLEKASVASTRYAND